MKIFKHKNNLFGALSYKIYMKYLFDLIKSPKLVTNRKTIPFFTSIKEYQITSYLCGISTVLGSLLQISLT
mgnify:CR=1